MIPLTIMMLKYSDDDCSIDSYLDYCQQDNNALGYQQVDSYNFIHNTNTFTPMAIPQDFDDEHYSYLDKTMLKLQMVLVLPIT